MHGRQGPRARRRGHDWVDGRNRALHAAIAAHLQRDPSLLRVTEANLDRLESTAAPGAQWAVRAWRRLLRELPLADLLAFLASEDERATELRQSTPFFGILPPAERDAVFARFEAR